MGAEEGRGKWVFRTSWAERLAEMAVPGGRSCGEARERVFPSLTTGAGGLPKFEGFLRYWSKTNGSTVAAPGVCRDMSCMGV